MEASLKNQSSTKPWVLSWEEGPLAAYPSPSVAVLCKKVEYFKWSSHFCRNGFVRGEASREMLTDI